jgi:hypothetical protein
MSNVVSREFWNAKLEKAIQSYEYGQIEEKELVDSFVRMGYGRKQVRELLKD